jgi:hypothetical protein
VTDTGANRAPSGLLFPSTPCVARVRPLARETTLSFTERLARRLHTCAVDLIAEFFAFGNRRPMSLLTPDGEVYFNAEARTRFAALARVPEEHLRRALPAWTRFDPQGRHDTGPAANFYRGGIRPPQPPAPAAPPPAPQGPNRHACRPRPTSNCAPVTSSGSHAPATPPHKHRTTGSSNWPRCPQYKRREGTVTVPRGHAEELEDGSVKLGVWISNTKSRRAKLTPQQLDQLAQLGLDWH